MQTRSSVAAVLGVLATGSLPACKASSDAVEVPTQAPSGSEASCRHELGRCGGHKPGDDACGAGPRTSADDESKPAPQDIFPAVVIEPGKFAESDLEMAKGAAVTVEFVSTGAPVAWNVHSHVGEQAVVHAEGSSVSDAART
jgi:hypothetical protein